MSMNLVIPTQWSSSLSQSSNELLLGGSTFLVQNASKSYSISSPGGSVLRFQVDPGDVWYQDPATKERSEIASTAQFSPGTQVNVSYSMTLEPGAANTASFLMLGQFHQTDYAGQPTALPPFSVEMDGEKMEIMIGYQNNSGQFVSSVLWEDPNNIVRGHNYGFQISAVFDDNADGRLVVSRDGQTLVNYSGPIGYQGQNASVYWKEGIYRGASNTVMAADYSNLQITTGGAAPAAATPPKAAFTEKLSYDSGPSASDFVSNTGWTTLQGTTSAGATVKVYDGSTLLRTLTADNFGNWTLATNLGLGVHTLSDQVTSGNLSSSYVNSQTINIQPQVTLATPVVTGISPDTGLSAKDGVTDQSALIISGTASAGSNVNVYVDGTLAGAAVTAANGVWSLDDRAHPLSNGQHTITASSYNPVESAISSGAYKLTVDTAAPALSVTSLWTPAGGGLAVQGNGENTAQVSIMEGSSTVQTHTVGGSGQWSLALGSNTGVHSYSINETDVAGNVTTLPFHLIAGYGSNNTITPSEAGDWLWGGTGNDTYVLTPTTAAGAVIENFEWNDHIQFSGFNAATTHVTQVDSTHWTVSDGLHTDTFTLANGAALPHSDWLVHG